MENQDNINETTNDQSQMEEDKETSLTVRMRAKLRAKFKGIEGKNDTDRFERVMTSYDKQKETQEKFSIEQNLIIIEQAFNTMKSQIKAISSATNQYERTLRETYVDGIANEITELKNSIENEEVLNARIIKLEKDLETLQSNYDDQEMIISSSNDRIKELEMSNSDYIALNSTLVSKENDYINELRKKDQDLNSKDLQINKLINDHKSTIESLEEQYKDKIAIVEADNKTNLEKLKSSYIGKINELEKSLGEVNETINNANQEKAILNNKISVLESNETNLKADIETMRKDFRDDIKELEKEHRQEIKDLHEQVSNAKETTKEKELEIANLNRDIDNLNNEKKLLEIDKQSLEGQVNALEDTINALNDSLETKETELLSKEKQLSDKGEEIKQLKESLKNANSQIETLNITLSKKNKSKNNNIPF